MNHPKISIIMPVFNMAYYLEQCLNGWTGQTLQEIEIVCVDDASTDDSYAILEKWAEKDCRVILYRFEQNSSAFMARKKGVQMAKGEYIMFADADDEILPNACEELYHEMKKNPVDILHFDTEIINVNGVSQARIDSMQRFVTPYKGTINGSEVFTACFRNGQYTFSLWNKIYKTDLCKKAMEALDDAVLPKAQDKLTYMAISYFAQSYRGLPKKKYYRYYFGRGGTGFNRLTMKQFERYCTMGLTANAMRVFLEKQGKQEVYSDIEQKNRMQLLNDCVSRWNNEVADYEKAEAFDMMLRYWSIDEVIGILAQKNFGKEGQFAKLLQNANSLKYDKREVKTIATYYHSCVNGGVQRVLCSLCELWVKMGYRVIVLTDWEPTQNDYILPESVKRIVIPDFSALTPQNYAERAKVLCRLVKEEQIDTVVYHAWVMRWMLWDELVFKASGAAFIAHCHSVFSSVFMSEWLNPFNQTAAYTFCDAVVTLSKADAAYWRCLNGNVFDTINPFTDSIDQWKMTSGIDGHDILWVGRVSSEKRPYDLLHILKDVIEAVPDAKLHILGDAKDKHYMNRFVEEIKRMKLEDNVVLHGFQADVEPYYQSASIFLITSKYEGYGLALQESKMAGLPCVMYELPYLTLARGNRGIMPVPQGDRRAASDAIIDLLTNDEKRRQYGKDAREHIEEFFGFDFEAKWAEIFESIRYDHSKTVNEDERIMMETLLYHYEIGTQRNLHGSKGMIFRIKKRIKQFIRSWKEIGMKETLRKVYIWIKRKLKNKKR